MQFDRLLQIFTEKYNRLDSFKISDAEYDDEESIFSFKCTFKFYKNIEQNVNNIKNIGKFDEFTINELFKNMILGSRDTHYTVSCHDIEILSGYHCFDMSTVYIYLKLTSVEWDNPFNMLSKEILISIGQHMSICQDMINFQSLVSDIPHMHDVKIQPFENYNIFGYPLVSNFINRLKNPIVTASHGTIYITQGKNETTIYYGTNKITVYDSSHRKLGSLTDLPYHGLDLIDENGMIKPYQNRVHLYTCT